MIVYTLNFQTNSLTNAKTLAEHNFNTDLAVGFTVKCCFLPYRQPQYTYNPCIIKYQCV